MTINRRTLGRLTLASLLLAATPLAAAEPIRIGAINPYSGGMAQYGDEVTRGFELAATWINAKGGIDGRMVEIFRGNATSAQEAIGAVEQLVGRDKVDILTGTYVSSISNAASENALNYGKLFWETNALALTLTERGLPNYARTGPSSNQFASRSVQGALELVATRLGKTPSELTVYLEHEDSAYGTSIAAEQVRLFGEAGVTPGVGSHSFKSIDLTDSVLRAQAAAPDLWITTGYVVDTNLLLRTAREQGFAPKAIMLMGVGDTSETLSALGQEYLEGILLVSYPRPDINDAYGPGSSEFLELYRKTYGRDPIAPQGMNAFVGMKVLFDAIKAAGTTEYEAVIAAAAKMDMPGGSLETGYGVKFDASMQNVRALPVIAQWQAGQVKAVYPPEAASDGIAIVNLPRM
ncbi:MAG: branched-chain amino acid transport system substrate-binding protein [Paracoccaceae bacterium]|jgi:branched-chain amino acid transport system substrate-binding protein